MASIAAGDPARGPILNITHDRYIMSETGTLGTGGAPKVIFFNHPQVQSEAVHTGGLLGTRTFTMLRSGIWFIEFAVRIDYPTTDASSGSVYARLHIAGSTGSWLVLNSVEAPIPLSTTLAGSTTRSFQAGESVEVTVTNWTNQILTFAPRDDGSHISLTWLQPA